MKVEFSREEIAKLLALEAAKSLSWPTRLIINPTVDFCYEEGEAGRDRLQKIRVILGEDGADEG
jgi:hypothetical protein